MQLTVNNEMIAAAMEVLDEAIAWPDYPYTNEQLVEAMLRNALRHYVEPPAPQPPKAEPKKVGQDDGFVYFISDGEAIKIGKANNVKSRLSGLQTSSSKPLTCLGFVKGGLRKERELHSQFEQFRKTGEWFEDAPEIRSYISAKCRPLANDNRRRQTGVLPSAIFY